MPARDPQKTVAVVGGGLAGMAAAARLAKLGHQVTLYEARDTLGGTWAPYPLHGTDVRVDDAPAVLGFPAPWRDLFRKSGRPLEAELERAGYALVPAAPIRYTFPTGEELVLPTHRGDQDAEVAYRYALSAGSRWRGLADGLDDVWQALRPLGLESERGPDALTRDVRRRLWSRRTVADLAEQPGHDALRAVLHSLAHRQGSAPARTPALAAVELSLSRTFGRWHVEPTEGRTGDAGRSSVLVELLADRLRLRGVEVRLGSRVEQVLHGDHVTGVATASVTQEVGAVVLTVDLAEAARLAPQVPDLRRAARRTRPALAPTVTHALVEPSAAVSETVDLDRDGVPVVTYEHRAGDVGVRTVHDYRRPVPRPSYGLAGPAPPSSPFRAWARGPGTQTALPGLVLAGPFSPAGPGASQVVLSAALAAYAVAGRHD